MHVILIKMSSILSGLRIGNIFYFAFNFSDLKKKLWNYKIGIFQKMRIKNLRGGQWGPILKNSTPSPWKPRKTSSSAVFCAKGVWGLNSLDEEFQNSQTFQSFKLYFWYVYFLIDPRKGKHFWPLQPQSHHNGHGFT